MGFQEQQHGYTEPQVAVKPQSSKKRTVVVSLGVVLVLAAAVAAVSAVLCTTALSCTAAPLSMRLRGSEQQPSSTPAAAAPTRAGGGIWSGGNCPVKYLPPKKNQAVNATAPLLLGGAAGSCVTGCQPRDSMW